MAWFRSMPLSRNAPVCGPDIPNLHGVESQAHYLAGRRRTLSWGTTAADHTCSGVVRPVRPERPSERPQGPPWPHEQHLDAHIKPSKRDYCQVVAPSRDGVPRTHSYSTVSFGHVCATAHQCSLCKGLLAGRSRAWEAGGARTSSHLKSAGAVRGAAIAPCELGWVGIALVGIAVDGEV